MTPDEQDQSEALDEDTIGDIEYPPDQPLGVEEARVTTPTGDVPPDSVRERSWREEPEEPNAAPARDEDGRIAAEESALHVEEP